MIPSAYLIGLIAHQKPTAGRIIIASIVGLAVLYLIGLPYMYAIANFYLGKALSVNYVLVYGMLIYLPGDFLKIIAAALLCPRIARQIS